MKRELNEIESMNGLYDFIERHNLEKLNKEMYEKWKYKQYKLESTGREPVSRGIRGAPGLARRGLK